MPRPSAPTAPAKLRSNEHSVNGANAASRVHAAIFALGYACALALTTHGLPAQIAPTARGDTVGAGAVAGTVRSGISGIAVPDARLDIPSIGAATRTDSAGTYELRDLVPGPVVVRVASRGFDTLSMQVIVPARGILHVDVALSPRLVILDSVHVNAVAAVRVAPPLGRPTGLDEWAWRGNPAGSVASTGESDALRALGGDPHLPMRPDWESSLADRGGSSDQILVRVDGIPVWSPVHAGGTLSAVSPDAIAALDLHDGAMPAAYGDRLAGVLDIRTRDSLDDGSTGTASLGPAAARATWAHPISVAGSSGSVMFALRRSDAGLPGFANTVGLMRDQWADGIATASLAKGSTSVRFIAIASGDLAAADANLIPAANAPLPAIPWNTQTVGLVWTQRLNPTARLESHLSTTAFGARVRGAADSTDPTLENAVRQTEIGTQLTAGPATIGVSIAALDVSYRVSDVVASAPATGATTTVIGPHSAPLQLVGGSTVLTAFADRRWGPGDSAWSVITGVRGMTLVGVGVRAEPRLGVMWRIVPGIVASVGYARTHQIVQSLRNTESPYGAQIGIDLSAAAMPGGVPIAQSDAGTAALTARLGSATRLSVDGYVRALSGLAVADPLHNTLFASTGFERASARVAGLGVTADGESGTLTWQAAYGLGRTLQSAEGVRYHPTSELGHSASVAAGVWLDRFTQARLAGWLALGQRAPGLDVGAVGRDQDGAGESLGGASDHGLAAPWVTASELPTYLRIDLELAHAWRTGRNGTQLSTFVTLANLLNHANIAAEVPAADGTLRGVTLLPRTLLFGVSWEY